MLLNGRVRTSELGQMYGVGIMAFILSLSTLVGVPVLPELSVELGADATEIPIVVSIALATVVVMQFFTGILADRYSRRSLILIGALLGSMSSLLCIVATHWRQLAFLRFIGGIADAVAMPAILAITSSLGKNQPGKFFGILRSSQGLSFVIAPVLGSAFSFVSLRTPFLVDGLLSLIAFMVAFFLMHDGEKATSEHRLSVFRGLRSTFSDRRVYLYLLIGISGLFGFGVLYSFVPTKAQIVGLRAWQIGVIFGVGALVFSTVSFVIGSLSDKYGRRAFIIISQIIIVAAGIGLLFSGGFTSLLALYSLFCVGETIAYLLCFVYAAEIFDKVYISTSMGAFDSVMDLSLFIGPLIGVYVYKTTGQIALVFLLACIPAILGLFSASLWLPPRRRFSLTLHRICHDDP